VLSLFNTGKSDILLVIQDRATSNTRYSHLNKIFYFVIYRINNFYISIIINKPEIVKYGEGNNIFTRREWINGT